MGDKVKVSVLETNNVDELEGPCERRLTADIVELDPPINGYDDVDQLLRNQQDNFSYNVVKKEVIIPLYQQMLVHQEIEICALGELQVSGELVVFTEGN